MGTEAPGSTVRVSHLGVFGHHSESQQVASLVNHCVRLDADGTRSVWETPPTLIGERGAFLVDQKLRGVSPRHFLEPY